MLGLGVGRHPAEQWSAVEPSKSRGPVVDLTGIFFPSDVAGKATRTQSGREGQTAYYVERKALRCGARKATLLHDEPDRKSFVSDGDSRENPKSGVDLL